MTRLLTLALLALTACASRPGDNDLARNLDGSQTGPSFSDEAYTARRPELVKNRKTER